MQYMLMCCFDEKAWTKLPDEDKEVIMREYGELMQNLAKRGHLRGGGKLRSSSAATTVRMKHGKPILTDGPFAETREQLGGYAILEAKSKEEAIQLADRAIDVHIKAGIAEFEMEIRPLSDPADFGPAKR